MKKPPKIKPKIGNYVICFEKNQPEMDNFLLSTIGQITDISPWVTGNNEIHEDVLLYEVKLERTIEDPRLQDRVPERFFLYEIKHISSNRNDLVPFIESLKFGI